MKRPRPTIRQIAARRRGILAISLAVAMMLIIFGTLLGLTQSLAAGYLRTENAWAAAQALYPSGPHALVFHGYFTAHNIPVADIDTDLIFADGFESGDLGAW